MNTDPKPVTEEVEESAIATEEEQADFVAPAEDGGGPLIPKDPLKP